MKTISTMVCILLGACAPTHGSWSNIRGVTVDHRADDTVGFTRARMGTRESGHVRTYYVAADEVMWDYAPAHADLIHNEPYHYQDDPGSKGLLDPNSTSYRKVLYREYTDSTFSTLKTRSAAWEHLGILGTLIRAEVGDTIRMVFRNHASRPYSVQLALGRERSPPLRRSGEVRWREHRGPRLSSFLHDQRLLRREWPAHQSQAGRARSLVPVRQPE